MGGKVGRTSKIAAAVVLIVNLIVMVLCTLLFGFALWMTASSHTLSDIIQTVGSPAIKALLSPPTLTVTLGVAIAAVATFFFFVAIMGFYGAITRSQFLLFMYSTLVLLLLLLECALMYYFSSSLIEKGLQEQDGQWTHALRLAFKCCEHNATIPQAPKLPWSCCGSSGYPENCTSIRVFDKDCQQVITNWLHRYSTAIYASLAVLHIVLASCSILRRSSASRSYS